MNRINGWLGFFLLISLFASLFSFFFSFFVYRSGISLISAHASSQADLGLSVETSGAICGDSLCNGAETCSTCSTDCGACAVVITPSSSGGGGGGAGGSGGGIQTQPSFLIDNENFNVRLVSGESESRQVNILNNGVIPIKLSIDVTGIDKHIFFNSTSIIILPGESFPLIFTLNAPEPGVYAGKVILSYQGIEKEIFILFNVISEGVLFDATVTIPELYRVLKVGQRLPVLIELLEVGGESGVDVTMEYVIKDFEGNTKYSESETFYVLGAKSYNKKFSTAGLDPDDYILGIELSYPGGFATSSAHFRITEAPVISLQTWIALGGLIIAIIVITILVLFYRRKSLDNLNSDLKRKVKRK